MTDATDEAPRSAIDAGRLIADLRGRGERYEVAIREAYQLTFGSELGRLVLAHHLADSGVGQLLGREALEYHAGRHDGAIALMNLAGFDNASAVLMVMTDNLEGADYERNYDHRNGDDDPVVFDDH